MKPSVFIPVLLAVFLVATVATAFALTLVTGAQSANAGFFTRLVRHACTYGWAAGLAVVVVFYFMKR
jgi:hypothetical protein